MELWDVYDKDGNLTGRTISRTVGVKAMPKGDYHLAVTVVIVNSKREMFCTHRSPEKPLFPGMWENTGGSVLAGETSIQGAIRELKEETGLAAVPEELTFLYRIRRADSFMDVYGLRRDFTIDQVVFQPGETDGAKWFPYEEWEQLARSGAILTPAGSNNEEFFAILRKYIKEG